MTATHQLQKIKEECRDWIVELADEGASPQERIKLQSEFQTWIRAHTLHAECFEETQRLWGAIGQMHHLEGSVTKPVQPGLMDKVRGWVSVGQMGWKTGTVSLVAFAVLVIVVGLNLRETKEFSTQTAELRDVILPDQSLVTLGAKTTIEIKFIDEKRQVFLKNGDAFFTVRKDPDRPFFVAVDGVNIRVVGTRFDVHHGPVQVRVSVLEGVVEVTTPKSVEPEATVNGSEKATLTLGQQVIVDKQNHSVKIKQINIEDLASWRSGWLAYDGVNLRDVVADANRYYHKEIILGSADIETLKVTASFRANRIDQMLTTLLDALPIVADRRESGRIILRPASK